jgi:hypothetical protein
MHRANAYAALSEELASWRQRSSAELAAHVGKPAIAREVKVANEIVTIELTASWANRERTAVQLHAVAFGPSHWRMEQLTEHAIIPLERK